MSIQTTFPQARDKRLGKVSLNRNIMKTNRKMSKIYLKMIKWLLCLCHRQGIKAKSPALISNRAAKPTKMSPVQHISSSQESNCVTRCSFETRMARSSIENTKRWSIYTSKRFSEDGQLGPRSKIAMSSLDLGLHLKTKL